MIISNDILVGVQYKKLCDFYSTLKEYAARFLEMQPMIKDRGTLVGLEVYKNDKDELIENYYISTDGSILSYKMTTPYTKEMNKETEIVTEIIDEQKMFNNINKQNYVLDIDYFINNN